MSDNPKPKLTLDLYDYHGTKLCPLYDSGSDVSGQAYNVHIVTERNGWKTLSFDLPGMTHTDAEEEKNFRIGMLKSDYKIRSEDEKETDWFIVNEDKVEHKALSKDYSVTAGHVSQLLKQKNLDLEFSDENGGNIGDAETLLTAVLKGTGWKAGKVHTFLEDDGTVKYRSLKAGAKTGAFKLVTTVADLFEAKPIFHGDTKTVDLIPMNPFTMEDGDIFPDTKDADAVMELHYGTNVSNVTRTTNSENIVTKLHVYGAYGDTTYGYCSIDECVHTIRSMVVKTNALLAGEDGQGNRNKYYFEVEDDSGLKLTRCFCPERDVYIGERLVFSFLDPASRMYVWHIFNDVRDDVYDEKGNRLKGATYVCTEEKQGTKVLYDEETVDPVWTPTVNSSEISATTNALSIASGVMHHWIFPDSTIRFKIDVYRIKGNDEADELVNTYTGKNVKFDVSGEEMETGQYRVEIQSRTSLVNYEQDDLNEMSDELTQMIDPESFKVRLAARNWFNFLMSFDYYRQIGVLKDDAIQLIAKYQTEAPGYYETAMNASLQMTNDTSELSKNIGTINFCKLRIGAEDPTPDTDENGVERVRLRIDKSEEYPDGVEYRTDYYVTNKENRFKWYGIDKLNEDGFPGSGSGKAVASVLYIIHNAQEHADHPNRPLKWDRAFLYNDRKDNKTGLLDDPDYLILHAPPGKITFDPQVDQYFLLQYLGTSGYLGAYESMDEAALKTLKEATTEATYEHPVFFGTSAPGDISDPETQVKTRIGGWAELDEYLSQEYSWYWQYDETGKTKPKMYFCFKAEGDEESSVGDNGKKNGVYYYVHYQDTEPSKAKNREYWFNYKTSKLYRYGNKKWTELDSYAEHDVASKFGAVHQECMQREMAYFGLYEKYKYTVPEETTLARGNYYMENGYDNAWIMTTTTDLPAGSTLTFNRRDDAVYQVVGAKSTTLRSKTVPLDGVRYHAQNLLDGITFAPGWIDTEGAIDDTNESCCYTKSTMYVYPNVTYRISGLGNAEYRVIEYSEVNTNMRFSTCHDHQLSSGDDGTFVTSNSTNYIRICIKEKAESVNSTRYDPRAYATCRNNAFVTDNVNYIRLDGVETEGDKAGIVSAMEQFSVLADKVYKEDYGALKTAQGKVDVMMTDINEALGDMMREGYWQDSSYVDGDEAKLYKDALEKLNAAAKPEVKYSIKMIDTAALDSTGEDTGVTELTRSVRWPWVTTESAVHLLDPEIGVDEWAYVDKVDRCYDDPLKTNFSINTNLSAITQHTFGDVLANIADVAYETRTSSTSGLKKLSESASASGDIAAMYRQEQISETDRISRTLSSMQTVVTGIGENYVEATALSKYSTIEQTSEMISTTVTEIQKDISGGANLIKESNFFMYKTREDQLAAAYRLDLAEEYTTNIFVNQYLTLSYYLDSQGDRAQLFGPPGQFGDYFGAGVVVIWGSSSNAGDDKVVYYLFDMCEAEGIGRRVSATAKIAPPDDNCDVIREIYVSVQLNARPANSNTATWVFGQPQLEVGKFCTGYKESAFEIKAFAQSQIEQTAEEIRARVDKIDASLSQYAQISITSEGVVTVAQTIEGEEEPRTATIDTEPYNHPITQYAWTKSPAKEPREEEWQDGEWSGENQAGYLWTRTVIRNNGTIMKATTPTVIDLSRQENATILSAKDEYYYAENLLEGTTPNPKDTDEQLSNVHFVYKGKYEWALTGTPVNGNTETYYLFKKTSTLPTGIQHGDKLYLSIDKSSENEYVSVCVRKYYVDQTTNKKVYSYKYYNESSLLFDEDGIPEDTVGLHMYIRVNGTCPELNDYRIKLSLTKKPVGNDGWVDEYMGPKNDASLWIRQKIVYNDGTVVHTEPMLHTMAGVKNIDTEYGTGKDPAAISEWTTDLNSIINANTTLWTRVVYTYNDGTSYKTKPVKLNNNTDAKEIPEIRSVTAYYYNGGKSLSEAELTDYEIWKTDVEGESGKTMWVRNKVIYTDGSVVWSEPQECTAYNALFLNTDTTINCIQIRYALSDDFVPPKDNAGWSESLPAQSVWNENENKYVWFSPWTWCENQDIYKGIPVLLTNDKSIHSVTAQWTKTSGSGVIEDNAVWNSNISKAYETKDDNHLWIRLTYKTTVEGKEKTNESSIARARYYDNLIDGAVDLSKSYQELTSGKYIQKIYETQYDESGNSIDGHVSTVMQTAKGIYQYLSGEEDMGEATTEITSKYIYEKLTSSTTGAISEIKQTADDIALAVGGLSVNEIADSDLFTVIDYERDEDLPVECVIGSGFFDIDNVNGFGEKTTLGDFTATTITGKDTTYPKKELNPDWTNEEQIKTETSKWYSKTSDDPKISSKEYAKNGVEFILADIRDPIEPENNKCKITIGKIQSNMERHALGSDVYSIRAELRIYNYGESKDHIFDKALTKDEFGTKNSPGKDIEIELDESKIGNDGLTIKLFVGQTLGMQYASNFGTIGMKTKAGSIKYTAIETKITGYTVTGAEMKDKTQLFKNSIVKGYTLSGQIKASNGMGLLRLLRNGDNDKVSATYEIPANADDYRDFEITIDPPEDLEKSRETKYSLQLYPSAEKEDYTCDVKNVTLMPKIDSTNDLYHIPISEVPLEKGYQYVVSIACIKVAEDSTKKENCGFTLEVSGMPTEDFARDIEPGIDGELALRNYSVAFTYSEDVDFISDEQNQTTGHYIYAYAGKKEHTSGMHIQLFGVSIKKYPKFTSETIPFVESEEFKKHGDRYILSVFDVYNNKYTLDHEGKERITDTGNDAFFNHIEMDQITCTLVYGTKNNQIKPESGDGIQTVFNVRGRNDPAPKSGMQYMIFNTENIKSEYMKLRIFPTVPGANAVSGGSITLQNVQLEEAQKDNNGNWILTPSEWKPKAGEASQTFTNNVLRIDNKGIHASGGIVDIQAGSSFKVDSKGTIAIESDSDESIIRFGKERKNDDDVVETSFQVNRKGELQSKSATFDDLIVANRPISMDIVERMIDAKIKQQFEEWFIVKTSFEELAKMNYRPTHDYFFFQTDSSGMLEKASTTKTTACYDMHKMPINLVADSDGWTIFEIGPVQLPMKVTTQKAQYGLSFWIRNKTPLGDNKHAFLSAIIVQAKGTAMNHADALETVYEESYPQGKEPGVKEGNCLKFDIISNSCPNVCAYGLLTYIVKTRWGAGTKVFKGEVASQYDPVFTVYIPPHDDMIDIGDGTGLLPFNVYYVPEGVTITMSASQEGEQQQEEQSGGDEG